MQEKSQTNEQTPIQKGEIFDAEKEVWEILKLPKEERKKKLAIFKEKLTFQKVGLARVQDIMIDEIRQKPEEGKEKLYEMAIDLGAEFGMNDKQKQITKETFLNYEERHKSIEKLRKEHPKDADFFNTLFRTQPKGQIEIIFGPASLYIKCYEFEDYLTICFNEKMLGSGKKRAFTDEEKRQAQESGATNVYCHTYPDIGWAVTAENTEKLFLPGDKDTDSQQKFKHEEQHAIKSLFQQRESFDQGYTSQYLVREQLLSANTVKEKEKIFEEFYRSFCHNAEEYAKDEMLAYYKDGRLDRVYEELTTKENDGGIYDFLAEPKQMEYLWVKSDEETRGMAKNVADRILVLEYNQILEEGIGAIKKMEETGYEKEEIIALLTHEPLAKWGKVVLRIVDKK